MSGSIKQEKRDLRRRMLRIREEMPFETRLQADAAITRAVLSHPAFQAADRVFAYVSMPHEVGTRALLEACLQAGKTLGLPVCDMQTHEMVFYRLDALSELKTGAYRIPVPPDSDDRRLMPTDGTLMLVPMLAYDAEGYRLGAGGGFYDRYLAAHSVQNAGLCYAACRSAQLPREACDFPLQCCITEQKTEEFVHGRS